MRYERKALRNVDWSRIEGGKVAVRMKLEFKWREELIELIANYPCTVSDGTVCWPNL